jgi:pyruvate,orthophosphate dikinase
MRIDPAALDQLLHPTIDPDAETSIAAGLPASPGAATGEIVLTSDEAERSSRRRAQMHSGAGGDQPGRHSRHARRPGHPDDRGGMTSHAAVVARGMGTPCVSGAGSIRIDYAARYRAAAKT